MRYEKRCILSSSAREADRTSNKERIRNMSYENHSCGCNDKPIKGIVCDVENCRYHESEHCCCASQISVGPKSANCSSDTVCATFQPKGE